LGLNTLVKGWDILDDGWSYGSKRLEMRINIKRRIVRVGSLSYYSSVVQADQPKSIDPATPYRFFL